jgi:LAS superfamily LD-carboxypeptidase LdcB
MKYSRFSWSALGIAALAFGHAACSESAAADAGKAQALAQSAPQQPTGQPPSVDADYLLGKFNPAEHPDFVAVGKPYASKPGMMLRKEAFEAFQKMWQAAKAEGIVLDVISSTRNFQRQKEIWEGKWQRFAKETPDPKARALRILEYSSMPGSSRHHWGTDMDLNDLNNAAFEPGGKHEKLYQWLLQNAHQYGFCQPYTAGRPHGYQEEKWHWTYTPLSKGYLEAYQAKISEKDIQGFKGAELAPEIGIVAHYVLGINAACK